MSSAIKIVRHSGITNLQIPIPTIEDVLTTKNEKLLLMYFFSENNSDGQHL